MILYLSLAGCLTAPDPEPVVEGPPTGDTAPEALACSAVEIDGGVEDCWAPQLWEPPLDLTVIEACCGCEARWCDPEDTCADGVEQREIAYCAETTSTVAGVATVDGATTLTDWTISGEIVEVGTGLANVSGSEGVAGHDPCFAPFDQVRVRDAAGDLWTVGWSVEDGLASAALTAVGVGQPVTLRLREERGPWSHPRSFLLEDAAGPLWVGDRDRLFGSFGMTFIETGAECWTQGDRAHEIEVSSALGTVSAWPGDVVELPMDPPMTGALVYGGYLPVTESGGDKDYWAWWRTP